MLTAPCSRGFTSAFKTIIWQAIEPEEFRFANRPQGEKSPRTDRFTGDVISPSPGEPGGFIALLALYSIL